MICISIISLSTKKSIPLSRIQPLFDFKIGIYSLYKMVTQILKTWICHLIKTVLFYLNNYENKVFNNRTEYSNCLQHAKNHHLLSPSSSICDVVKQRDTCVWLFYFPNIYGWVLGYGVESVSKIPRISEFEPFCM